MLMRFQVRIRVNVSFTIFCVDEVILLSGDGDFEILVERIQQKFGKKVTVYGVPGLTAQNLQAVVDRYIPIEDELLLP